MTTDFWACSCHAYFDEYDVARAHSKRGHDVTSREHRDGRAARERVDIEREAKEEA